MSPTHSWTSRKGLARLLDAAVLVAPVLASSTVLWSGMHLTAGGDLALRIPVLLVLAAATGWAVERAVRRLVPIATLMRLSLVFPDRAPTRMSVARMAGNPAVLRHRLTSLDLSESAAAKTILALVASLARHDRRTRGHSERVRVYTDMISQALGLTQHDRDRLRWTALLHDIGKLEVDPHILQKPGKPTKAEWVALKAHPVHGADLAAPLLPWLGEWGLGIVEHHERYDGSGYPDGLQGAQISWGARIISVADSFETMTAVRPYKKAMSHRQARIELAECAGTQFDPVVVRTFLALSLPSVIRAMGPVAAIVQMPFVSSIQFAGVRVADVSAMTAVVTAPAIAAGIVAGPVAPVGPYVPSPAVAAQTAMAGGSTASSAAVLTLVGSTASPEAQVASEGRGRSAFAPGHTKPDKPKKPKPTHAKDVKDAKDGKGGKESKADKDARKAAEKAAKERQKEADKRDRAAADEAEDRRKAAEQAEEDRQKAEADAADDRRKAAEAAAKQARRTAEASRDAAEQAADDAAEG